MTRRIRPDEVEMGMYVEGFTGSWLSHPFWRAKFVVDDPKTLARVRQSDVDYVLVDDGKSVRPEPAEDSPSQVPSKTSQSHPSREKLRIWPKNTAFSPVERERTDLQRARTLVTRSKKLMRETFTDVRLGRAIRMNKVSDIVADVVESIEESPEALLKVVGLKKKSEYTYMHSIAVCALMVNVARQQGKPMSERRKYGLAGLLHDLGKVGIPEEILNDEGSLTDTQLLEVRKHPQFGHSIISELPEMPDHALDVCLHHHEKMDGTGYPKGLAGHEISEVARLGAICDVYDALTSDRGYKNAWTPVDALAYMWGTEGHFDRSLLFAFMQSVGIFAPGMLVTLRSNRRAEVLEPGKRRGTTRLRLCVDPAADASAEPEEITLTDDPDGEQIAGYITPKEQAGLRETMGLPAAEQVH
ncbi:HD-GYP domain-containing protein [Qipengyuania algicida]|nr:HD-GYP domain-containing protein [Qipengyuania algicida]